MKAHVKENNKRKVSIEGELREFNCLNALTTAVKKNLRTINCDGRVNEDILTEDLEIYMTLCLTQLPLE